MNTLKVSQDLLRKNQPLIIIGMHRSGTSLVARLLSDLGIQMGHNLSRDAESIFFQRINRRIYKSAGSNWGNIERLLVSMEDERFIEKEVEKVQEILFPEKSFLGLNQGVAHHFSPVIWSSLMKGDDVWWGWKDPRTTLTFPIWLRIFPNARVLHIIRSGIDVAISTHRRSLKQQGKFWKRIIPLDFIPKTLDFNYCYDLWKKYVSFALKKKSLIHSERYLEIKYEELLSHPMENIKEITNFIEFKTKEETVKEVCTQIDRSRVNNSHYTKIYQKEIQRLEHFDLLDQLGYRYPLTPITDEVNFEK